MYGCFLRQVTWILKHSVLAGRYQYEKCVNFRVTFLFASDLRDNQMLLFAMNTSLGSNVINHLDSYS